MEKQTIEMLEGTTGQDAQRRFKDAMREIVYDALQEGFEIEDVVEYFEYKVVDVIRNI